MKGLCLMLLIGSLGSSAMAGPVDAWVGSYSLIRQESGRCLPRVHFRYDQFSESRGPDATLAGDPGTGWFVFQFHAINGGTQVSVGTNPMTGVTDTMTTMKSWLSGGELHGVRTVTDLFRRLQRSNQIRASLNQGQLVFQLMELDATVSPPVESVSRCHYQRLSL